MSRILCVAVVMSGALLTWAGPALAGMSEGVAAVTVGDYPKAIAEFQPLAASGDPAAQYQLAKIYLEGHGPVDGVPQGIDLMTKAANGNYPEAQAQLGLMYAMGLGVPADNVKAYDWLSKAMAALPDGTRRTVAEANRDAVLKRMNASQQAAVAPATTTTKAADTQAAATQAAAAKPAATTTAAKPTVTETAAKPAATTANTATSAKTATATATKPTVTETAAKPAATTANTATSAKTVTATTAKPIVTEAAAKPAATANTATAASKPASGETATKTPDSTTKVASAKTPDASPASQQAAPSGVRIQLISMPSEEAAWNAWKQLSGKYSTQLTGLTAIVQSADLGTKGTFYRVQTGPFETVAAAQERCSAMKQAGLDCLVVGKP